MPDSLCRALAALLPPDAGAGWADPRKAHALWPGEGVARATPTRQAEFSAGRHAARMALRAIGLSDAAIPQGCDRAPIWPAGIIGSITHSATACLAVAMQADAMRGIGIDLEPALPMDAALWDSILLPAEQGALATLPPADRGLAALRIFCAKEAAFKAHYPTTCALVGFEVMEVHIDTDRFTGTFQTALAPLRAGQCLHGRIIQSHGHILALATL